MPGPGALPEAGPSGSRQAAEPAERRRPPAAEAPSGEGKGKGMVVEPAAKKRRDATSSTKMAKKRKVSRKQ